MKRLNFSINGIKSISDELCKPIAGISTKRIAHGMTIGLILWHQDGAGICCSSKMHDVAPRVELGVLELSKITGAWDKKCEGFFKIEFPLFATMQLFRMTIEMGEIVAESGLVFCAAGNRFTIVCGASPYSLAVCDSRFPCANFSPEFNISEYVEELM